MKSARLPLQKAIKAALEAAYVVAGVTCPVVTNPAQGQAYPYTVIGMDTEVPAPDKAENGSDLTHTWVTWSESQTEAKQIAAIGQEAVTGPTKLTLDAPFTVISQDLDQGLPPIEDRSSEGDIYGVPVRARFLVCH